jgi:hypothetical protein
MVASSLSTLVTTNTVKNPQKIYKTKKKKRLDFFGERISNCIRDFVTANHICLVRKQKLDKTIDKTL